MESSRRKGAAIWFALVVMVIASGAVACGSNGGAAAPPSTSGPTYVSPASTTPSPSASASPMDGTWQTAHLGESDVASAFVAAGGSRNDGLAFFQQLGDGPGKKYAVITLKLLGGTFSEFESGDGSPPVQGYEATYEISSGDVLTVSTPPGENACTGSYSFNVEGNELRLHVIKQCASHDGPYNTTLFASFPFTRVG